MRYVIIVDDAGQPELSTFLMLEFALYCVRIVLLEFATNKGRIERSTSRIKFTT